MRQWMAINYQQPPVFKVEQLIAEGPYVAVLGTITLASGDGKPVAHAYCDVWQFRDGKMVGLKAFVIAPQESHF